MCAEQVDRPGQSGAGGVVSRGGQQQHEGAELLRGEAGAVDLGEHQLRGDVVAGMLSPLLAERDGVLEEFDDGLHACRGIAHIGVLDAEDEVDQLSQPGPVRRRDVEQVGDHLKRQVRADGVDEVEAACFADLLDDDAGEFTHVIRQLANLAGRERNLHEAAILTMLGIVHRDDRAHHLQDFPRHVIHRESLCAGEGFGIPCHRTHVGVGRHRPEAPTVFGLNEFDAAAAVSKGVEGVEPRRDVAVPEGAEIARVE